MPRCPRCGSVRLLRSHARLHERPRRWISGALLFRCRECNWRGWNAPGAKHDSGAVWLLWGLATVVIAVAALAGGALFVKGSSPRATPAPTPAQSPSLALLSSRALLNPAGDLWNITGEVRNLTQEGLTNLQVVSTWFDQQGRIIDVQVDLVDLKQLMPGEISTFRSVARARPQMSMFRLEFRSDLGTLLLSQDSSPTP
jgi:hypothetical protein